MAIRKKPKKPVKARVKAKPKPKPKPVKPAAEPVKLSKAAMARESNKENNAAAVRRIRSQLNNMKEAIVKVEENLALIDNPSTAGQELTTDQVIDIYGISRRQLTSFRARGLQYSNSKPAKYTRQDIDAFLKKNNYKKTPAGWVKQRTV